MTQGIHAKTNGEKSAKRPKKSDASEYFEEKLDMLVMHMQSLRPGTSRIACVRLLVNACDRSPRTIRTAKQIKTYKRLCAELRHLESLEP